MVTIGTSYEEYKASHPLTQHLTPIRGDRPVSFATLSILKNAVNETDQDFLDPERLAVLSEEALREMDKDMRGIVRHADRIFHNDYGVNAPGPKSIKERILGGDEPANMEAAQELITILEDIRPEELGNLVVGMVQRDFVEGGMAAADVRAEIETALDTFKAEVSTGLEQAWARKTEINNVVEAVVNDGMAGVADNATILEGLTPEQEGYFVEQFEAYAEIQGMDMDVKNDVESALIQKFADPVPAAAPIVGPAPVPGAATP